ncbi:MAG: hypothetical protein MUF43_10480 [Flavobacterium sp.]|jgi:hypothetical protein|nr:hypothetical protein [Flavobacterium sp.]
MEPHNCYLNFPAAHTQRYDDNLVINRKAEVQLSSKIQDGIRFIVTYNVNRPNLKFNSNEVHSIVFVTQSNAEANSLYSIRPVDTDEKLVRKIHYRSVSPNYYESVYVDVKTQHVNNMAYVLSMN